MPDDARTKRPAHRPPKPAAERASRPITIYCTEAQDQALRARAAAAGLPVSQYVLRAALGEPCEPA